MNKQPQTTPQNNQPSDSNLPGFMEKAPQEYKSVATGKIILILVVVTLVSWAIIGGFIFYATQNVPKAVQEAASDVSNKVSDNTSSSTSTSTKPENKFNSLIKTIEISEQSFDVQDYTVKLDASETDTWEFVDWRTDSSCINTTYLSTICAVGALTLKDSGSDVSHIYNFGVTTSLNDFKNAWSNLGNGAEVTINGAVKSYVYNTKSKNSSASLKYIKDHGFFIEIDSDVMVWFYQVNDDVYFYADQTDMDNSSGTKYGMLLSVADSVINTLSISKK
jgi:hypothetical protein